MSEVTLDRDRLFRRWLGLLVGVASVAVLQAVVWPRWPRSPGLPAAQLGRELVRIGLNPRPLPTLPAQRSYERSLSALHSWRLATGSELRVLRGSVRQRDSFQAAFLGRDQPLIALVGRRLNVPMAGSAAGVIQGRPSYQTCLVPQVTAPAVMAVSAESLGRGADQRVASRFEMIKGLLGLQPTRSFDCILVSLRSTNDELPAVSLWRDVLAAVSSSFLDSPKRWL